MPGYVGVTLAHPIAVWEEPEVWGLPEVPEVPEVPEPGVTGLLSASKPSSLITGDSDLVV